MAQIITLPRTMSLTRQFEELALFTEKTASGDLFCAGLLDGTVEISFDADGDWWVSDIHIEVENYKRGPANRSKTVRIDADNNPALYWLLLGVLTDTYANSVAEWIAFEMPEAA
jgi:hypothetical protein